MLFISYLFIFLLDNPLTRNWLVCTEAHIYTANVVRNYVKDTFETFYKNESLLSSECPCKNGHKGSCDSHDNDVAHCVHYNRRSRTWRLATEPKCGNCAAAIESIIPLFKDIHSWNICWDNIKFWQVFQGSWNIAKLFMPPGNCNTDDPSITDERVLHHIMYACNLFEVNTYILNELIHNRIRLLQNEEMIFSDCDTDKILTLIIKFMECLPLGQRRKRNAHIQRIKQMKSQAANECMFEAALADKIHFLMLIARDSPMDSNDIFKQIEIVLRLKIEDTIRVEEISRYQRAANEQITQLSNERNDYADHLSKHLHEISLLRSKVKELEEDKEKANELIYKLVFACAMGIVGIVGLVVHHDIYCCLSTRF